MDGEDGRSDRHRTTELLWLLQPLRKGFIPVTLLDFKLFGSGTKGHPVGFTQLFGVDPTQLTCTCPLRPQSGLIVFPYLHRASDLPVLVQSPQKRVRLPTPQREPRQVADPYLPFLNGVSKRSVTHVQRGHVVLTGVGPNHGPRPPRFNKGPESLDEKFKGKQQTPDRVLKGSDAVRFLLVAKQVT